MYPARDASSASSSPASELRQSPSLEAVPATPTASPARAIAPAHLTPLTASQRIDEIQKILHHMRDSYDSFYPLTGEYAAVLEKKFWAADLQAYQNALKDRLSAIDKALERLTQATTEPVIAIADLLPTFVTPMDKAAIKELDNPAASKIIEILIQARSNQTQRLQDIAMLKKVASDHFGDNKTSLRAGGYPGDPRPISRL